VLPPCLHESSGRSFGVGEQPQAAAPSLGRPHGVAHLLPALAVALEVAVLELDARPIRRLGTSTSLVLSGSVSSCHRVSMSQLITTRLGGS
jgi:hypothetical protein